MTTTLPALTDSTTLPGVEPKQDLDQLLTDLVKLGGSDLHITAGIAPCMRVNGALEPVPNRAKLLPADTEAFMRSILSDAQWDRFLTHQELDTAYALPGVSRFRVNVYRQRGAVGAALRSIPHNIRGLEELGLPHSVENFAHLPRGLVLVTGPTGSGKSTTLASLLDVANRTRSGHIVTIEDPIEYLHSHRKCVVNQREVGSDTADFSIALKHVLRQDPDIILVGELRDLETTSVAVTAAETGHLVLATLHTQSAAQTIDRLIDIYPPHQQQQIRAQLANCLQGVVTQALVPRKDGSGRTIVCEIMVATSAIRNLIREGKVHQIPTFLQSSAEVGMISFDQHLAQRFGEQLIGKSTALELAHDPNEFKRLARL
jgi:twitching motility protein PilT